MSELLGNALVHRDLGEHALGRAIGLRLSEAAVRPLAPASQEPDDAYYARGGHWRKS